MGGGTHIRLFESKFKKIFIELRRKEEREERDRKVRGKLLQILGAKLEKPRSPRVSILGGGTTSFRSSACEQRPTHLGTWRLISSAM